MHCGTKTQLQFPSLAPNVSCKWELGTTSSPQYLSWMQSAWFTLYATLPGYYVYIVIRLYCIAPSTYVMHTMRMNASRKFQFPTKLVFKASWRSTGKCHLTFVSDNIAVKVGLVLIVSWRGRVIVSQLNPFAGTTMGNAVHKWKLLSDKI